MRTAGSESAYLASVVCSKSFRISVKTPVYVAGFDRGVLPIGDWLTSITLSRYSSPVISLYVRVISLNYEISLPVPDGVSD